MIRVEAFDMGGKNVSRFDGTRILLSDKFNNPLVVAVEYEDGKYLISTISDDDFEQMLATLGVESAVVLNTLNNSGK